MKNDARMRRLRITEPMTPGGIASPTGFLPENGRLRMVLRNIAPLKWVTCSPHAPSTMTSLTCLAKDGYPTRPMGKETASQLASNHAPTIAMSSDKIAPQLSGTLLGLLLLSSCVYEPPRGYYASGQDTSSSGSSGTTPSGGAGGGGGSGGSATGGGGTVEQPPCHPAGLEDGFDGSVVNTNLWNLQGKQSIMSVTGSRLQVTPEDNINDGQWVGLVTKTTYNLKDCAVWIEAPSIVKNGLAGTTYWQLYTPDGSSAMKVTNGRLEASVEQMGAKVDQASISYVAATHRWWRIREAAGQLIMETSPDFIIWTQVLSTPTPSYIAQVSIGLGVISPMNQTSLGKTTFDNFNIVP